MRIPESKIAEVAAAADIVQVISGYVNLKKAGKDFRGVCPFHGDKDPSFYVSPHKGTFYCFGCAVGGSVFTFLMKAEGISFIEAVQMLAQRHGIPIALESGRGPDKDERERLAAALDEGQRYFVESLRGSTGAWEYLSGRGVSPEWMEHLGLGFAPDSWEGMVAFLRNGRVEVKDAVLAGLIKERATGGHYDFFRSRVIIPIRDLNGRIIAFGGRIVGEGDPKYLNSPDSPIFRKKGVLFGLDSARDAVRREGFVVLVEGYFDQMSLRMRGLENAVAPLGTSLGTEHVRLIKRFCSDVVTVFDGDEAGIRALKRSIPLFLAEGIEPRCVVLTEHKDPDEAVNQVGIEEFRRMVDAGPSTLDFLLDHACGSHDVSRLRGKNLALEELLPVLREVADHKERDYIIEKVAFRLKIQDSRLRQIMKSAASRGRPVDPGALGNRGRFAFPTEERNVLIGMLVREGFIERVMESGVVKDVEHPMLRLLAERVIAFHREHHAFDHRLFSASLDDEELADVLAALVTPRPEEDDLSPEANGDQVMDDSLDRIRQRKLERRKEEIKQLMSAGTVSPEEFMELQHIKGLLSK